ncbi:hypothetical protein [Kitasatospora sp. MMS16-BH015]|uniref:hypothetical protein n=1 Tax=Kitasatospora sp. MMS16-BH015 TaxID=2018025 RepID=UPI000CF2828A|nr:hypothetical protein [Kitasatospora sp. MMS16-BH015]
MPFGRPAWIVVLATPDGFRQSIRTVDGGLVCGKLPGLPVDAAEVLVLETAAAMVRELGTEFHGEVLDVVWEADSAPGYWRGQVRQRS